MNNKKYIVSAEEIAGFRADMKTHLLNPNAIRLDKSLGDMVGLRNLGFHVIEVQPGKESTEYHKHYEEEECAYVLAGEAKVTIGEEEYRVKAGDFIGYPANDLPHTMVNDGKEILRCIVVGQRLPSGVSEYPRKGKRAYRYGGTRDLVQLSNVEKLK
ncbi:MAG: cupin domain-containing protein [Candidatus Binatia bacterium]